MLPPVLLFRNMNNKFRNELEIAKKYFRTIDNVVDIQQDDLVIGRYSVLPYYNEVEKSAIKSGGMLINSFEQHLYVADIRNWYNDLMEFTPKTWFYVCDAPDIKLVVKGATNSKKFLWNTHMFAENKAKAIDVMIKLQDDGFIGDQDIYAREYIELDTLCISENGLPITKEFRFFILDGKIISGGFYWANFSEDFDLDANIVPEVFLDKVIKTVGDRCRFYTLDVARTKDGRWIVIELNDGQMSGLSMNDPDMLYSKLYKELN